MRSTNGVEKKIAEGFESAPVEQFYSWAFPFSPLALWDLCLRLCRFSRQACSPRGRARRFVSHCPSTGTAGSESCSNTATVVGKKRFKRFCKSKETEKQKTYIKT